MFYRAPIFQSLQRPQTWTLRSLHRRLNQRYLLYQRWADSINSINNQPSIPFARLWNIPGKFPTFLWLFCASKFQLKATVYALVFVYYKYSDSHNYLLYSSSHALHVKNSNSFRSFSEFVVYVVTLIFPTNQRQCASFSLNVERGFPSSAVCFTRGNTAVSGIESVWPCVWAHCERTS